VCGICGTTSAGDGAALRTMNASMVHRGPDDEGFYIDPKSDVGLGARRLSIIDVEGGHQPLSNEEGTVWAVLNGEIYNHPSLQRHLLERGHRLASRTDTEVLVHLYEDHGADLVHALEGMFAFAIWDSSRQLLVLGRDRFGEKPLFYTERGGTLTFASELRPLLRGVDLAWDLEPAALDAYFVFGYLPGSGSVVRGVQQVEPGSVLLWDSSTRTSTTRRYWSPPRMPARQSTPLSELVEETRQLLEAAVRSRLLSDVPLGVFLSGGVDSTLVAALAAGHSSRPLQTFTVGYDTGSVDETLMARRSAEAIGAEHHELVFTEADVAAQVPAFIRALGQPLADEAFVALRALAGFARPDVNVAVGGEGADELFGGYPRYRWLARAERVPAWVPRAKAARAAALLEHVPGGGRTSRVKDVLAPRSTLHRHVRWVSEPRMDCRAELYGPRLRSYLGVEPTPPDFDEIVGLNGSVEARFMRLDQMRWLPDDVLLKADRATMQASLEFRTPFLHRELAEFAASVPASTHVREGGKLLLRRVLHEVLPEAAHTRRKVAFRIPSAEWLRGPLRGELDEQLAASALYSEGWLERERVRAVVSEHFAGRDRSATLWPIFVLGLWLDGVRELLPA
jgi:asparagine synthase (glutamine-hydrolysing)